MRQAKLRYSPPEKVRSRRAPAQPPKDPLLVKLEQLAARGTEMTLRALAQEPSKAEGKEILRLAYSFYGWQIPWDKVSSDMKRDFKNHASVIALKAFYVPRSIVLPGQQQSVEQLQKQMDIVGEKLVALKDHLESEE